MYLMNVPPVAATQTEWRTCSPPGGYSLQCFNDSDTELSTRGTPISDKVQMIIESLRSTQSSLEMGDEIEGNVISGQDNHPHVCKVAVASYVGAKSKIKCPSENQQAGVNNESSDSDDSVDRGIEEAILEYLKEKDDHKRKAEPCSNFPQSSKIPRKTPPFSEISKQNSESNTFPVTSNQCLKSVKAKTLTAQSAIPLKKYIKNKAFLNNDMVKKLDPNKSTTNKNVPKDQTKSPSTTISLLNKARSLPPVKMEEDSNDSSSDDGIEEAIQRYQLEKRVQQNRMEASSPHAFKEESDSTSDDGIEEAIRCYQLEQLKEKSALKPFLHKQKPFSKSVIHSVGTTSMENIKKHKLKKKMTRTENEEKSFLPSSVFMPKNELTDSQKGNGNGQLTFEVDSFNEEPTPAPPKVNTTAELMCAEAILDISKTVMPGTFHHSAGLSCVPIESSLQSSLPANGPDGESNDSSIDSEDGIEQEIRKFLEQKAQMHKQLPSSGVAQEHQSINGAEKAKTKQVAIQKKPPRLSLTKRRKHKEESCSISGVDNSVKETVPKALTEHKKDSSPSFFSQRSPTHSTAGLHEQSGDKSSSLDSDEDLDTAIKDLLKTKKKSKKKTRDLKRKSRKCLKDEEPLLQNALQTKKLKLDPLCKCKVHKNKDNMKDKGGLSKNNTSQHKQTDRSKTHEQADGTETVKQAEGRGTPLQYNTQTAFQIKEDSSSVDSDDSIEQEIRKFLAEKAKVSTAEESKEEEDVSRNVTVDACTLTLKDEDIKQENELVEISSKSPPSPLSIQFPLSSPPQDRHPLLMPQSLLPAVSTVGAQSHLSSVQSCSPSLMEPADGAGAARTEPRRPTTGRHDGQHVSSQIVGIPVLSRNTAHSRSESIKWRQSLGLPITDTRTISRTPFQITSSKINETPSANTQYQSGSFSLNSQFPVSVWSSARTNRVPFSCSTEKTVNTAFRPPVLNLSTARQNPRMSFTQSLLPDHSSQCPMEGETESMVHMPKDKSVFVELESNRTNHVQVRSRERSEGKETVDLLSEKIRKGESMKVDEKEVLLKRPEEEFVDEADCKSGNRRNPDKKQGFSTLSLSRAIDPGITFRPLIALNTEERSRMFNRRYRKGYAHPSSGPAQNKAVQHVKRKLQFRVMT